MKNPVRILIVDSHASSRDTLAEALSWDPSLAVVARCSTASEAVAALVNGRIDVAIFSYAPGSGIGRPLIAWWVLRRHRTRSVVLTETLLPDEETAWFMQRHVAAVCLKTRTAIELAEIVRTVAHGGKWLEQPALSALLAAVTNPSAFAPAPGLTPGEQLELASLEMMSSRRVNSGRRRARQPRASEHDGGTPHRYLECADRDHLLAAYMRAQAEKTDPIVESPDASAAERTRSLLDALRRKFLEHCARHACVPRSELR
jgi:DNA-binding NarL/FixJ family response regulator